jgi:CRP-like cAMP-binding protein
MASRQDASSGSNVQRRPASPAEVASLHAALRQVSPLSDADLGALPAPVRVSLQRGAVFLPAGKPAVEVGAVLSGALREYFLLEDGTERTKGFNLAGDFAGSLSDLLLGGPARTWVVAEVPCVVLVLPWTAYRALVEARPAWSRFAREIAERLYRSKVQREYELLALDATARYRLALERWPELERTFTQQDIASYIGITPGHLSRLRALMATAPRSRRTRPAR